MAKRSDFIELSQRVGEVVQLKLDGFTRTHIQEYGQAKWGVVTSTVDNYIALANDRLEEINEANIQQHLSTISTNLWDLYRKAAKLNLISEQHKILMSIAKLRGLDQITVKHIVDDKRDHATMSDDELDQIISDSQNANH